MIRLLGVAVRREWLGGLLLTIVLALLALA
jgi:hypothetical protein